jgi:hypothetical protein
MTNERWLRWAIARYYRSIGYKVSMRPVRVGNAMVDGVAIGPEGERIAIEVKSRRDDIVRGIGQCYEALTAGYSRAILLPSLLFFSLWTEHLPAYVFGAALADVLAVIPPPSH